jgi:hypothetical protein
MGWDFTNHLASQGMKRRLTTHDTPEYNSVTECLNRTILEKVHAMLHASGLLKFLWAEVVVHAVYLKTEHQRTH